MDLVVAVSADSEGAIVWLDWRNESKLLVSCAYTAGSSQMVWAPAVRGNTDSRDLHVYSCWCCNCVVYPWGRAALDKRANVRMSTSL